MAGPDYLRHDSPVLIVFILTVYAALYVHKCFVFNHRFHAYTLLSLMFAFTVGTHISLKKQTSFYIAMYNMAP